MKYSYVESKSQSPSYRHWMWCDKGMSVQRLEVLQLHRESWSISILVAASPILGHEGLFSVVVVFFSVCIWLIAHSTWSLLSGLLDFTISNLEISLFFTDLTLVRIYFLLFACVLYQFCYCVSIIFIQLKALLGHIPAATSKKRNLDWTPKKMDIIWKSSLFWFMLIFQALGSIRRYEKKTSSFPTENNKIFWKINNVFSTFGFEGCKQMWKIDR